MLEIFNGPPETVTQTLYYTQNISHLATIWVAIVGVLLLTVVIGVVSTMYLTKQKHVALQSHSLALAQAFRQSPEALLSIVGSGQCATSEAAENIWMSVFRKDHGVTDNLDIYEQISKGENAL